jgi:glycosyltransferase involved in cell wall biosynthesis
LEDELSRAPKVSVCLTAYQRAGSIGRTIESILAQDFQDFELLIQDDASSDGTEGVCRSYEQKDARIQYQRNLANLSMPGNLNAVVARARASLIANLHDGDLFQPDLLRKWVDAIERTQAAFVFNALEVIELDGRHVGYHRHPFSSRLEPGELIHYMLERFDSPVWGTVMARRAAYQRVGAFNERYSFVADTEMWMRLNLKHPVAYVAEPLIKITPHEDDRPYAYVNWSLEQALVDMRKQIAEEFYRNNPAGAVAYQARLLRLRERRWLWLAGSCFKRGRMDLFSQALELFRRDDSLLLRAAARLGRPALAVGRFWDQ